MDSNKEQTAKDKYGNELRVGDAYDSSVDSEYLRCIGVVKSVDGVHIEGAEVWASSSLTTIELGCTRLAAEVAKLGEVGPRENLCARCFAAIDCCSERHSGFYCTLKNGHMGDHAAHTDPLHKNVVATWPRLIVDESTEPRLRITEASASCAYADGSETFSDGSPVTEPSDWPEVTLDEMPGGGK